MKDQELIEKLNNLKGMKLNTEWKESARNILLNQISNSSKVVKITFFDEIAFQARTFVSLMSRPVIAAFAIIFALVGVASGYDVARNSKPGDSFYAAKIMKDKAQVATIFNKEDKAKLEIKLASQRAAQISNVLSDPSFSNNVNNQDKVKELSQTFNQEINTVKQNIPQIKTTIKPVAPVVATAPVVDGKVGIGKVYSVESGKDNNGVQIYIPETQTTATKINQTLDKAQQSFDEKNFSGAKDILDQVNVIIDNINSNSTTATTTAPAVTPIVPTTEVKK
jgi:hypothetical protein